MIKSLLHRYKLWKSMKKFKKRIKEYLPNVPVEDIEIVRIKQIRAAPWAAVNVTYTIKEDTFTRYYTIFLN